MAVKYEVVDRLRYNGKDYNLGDEVCLEDVHAKPLLRVAVVKSILTEAKIEEEFLGKFEGGENDEYPPEALADVIANGIEQGALEMTKSGKPEVGSIEEFLKARAGDAEGVKTDISASERDAAWEIYQAREGQIE